MIDACLSDAKHHSATMDDSDVGSSPPVYDVRALTDAAGKAALVLDGMVYTLRITKQGKLLLTK